MGFSSGKRATLWSAASARTRSVTSSTRDRIERTCPCASSSEELYHSQWMTAPSLR